jgi:sugar lactone lactonase YvrE
MLTRASRSRTIGINVRLRRLTMRSQLDKVQIEAIELVLGEDNALDDATPDSRDKVVATTMVQQFDKTFRQLFAAARTEVQIFETDGF